MAVTPETIQKLKEPFPIEEINWRVGATNREKTKGLALAYIDARAVMDRLDEVCGPENWQKRYQQFGKDFVCEIGVNIEGVGWVWKSDGAGETDFEATKGGLSDAFKRAGVSWGIGRYLYKLEGVWVQIKQSGNSYTIENPPKMPVWALPSSSTQGQQAGQPGKAQAQNQSMQQQQPTPHLQPNNHQQQRTTRDEEIRGLCVTDEQKQIFFDFLKLEKTSNTQIRSVNDLTQEKYNDLVDILRNLKKIA